MLAEQPFFLQLSPIAFRNVCILHRGTGLFLACWHGGDALQCSKHSLPSSWVARSSACMLHMYNISSIVLVSTVADRDIMMNNLCPIICGCRVWQVGTQTPYCPAEKAAQRQSLCTCHRLHDLARCVLGVQLHRKLPVDAGCVKFISFGSNANCCIWLSHAAFCCCRMAVCGSCRMAVCGLLSSAVDCMWLIAYHSRCDVLPHFGRTHCVVPWIQGNGR